MTKELKEIEVMTKKEVVSYVIKLCEENETFDITLSSSEDPLHGENQYGLFGVNFFQKGYSKYKTEFLLFGSYENGKDILYSRSIAEEPDIEKMLFQWLNLLPEKIYVTPLDLSI